MMTGCRKQTPIEIPGPMPLEALWAPIPDLSVYHRLARALGHGHRSQRRVSGVRSTWIRRIPGDVLTVVYHTTPVVKAWGPGSLHPGRVEITSGGHATPTTKRRINDWTGAGIFQHRWTWYVGSRDRFFSDGMVI